LVYAYTIANILRITLAGFGTLPELKELRDTSFK
jgi:hypothetical protein